MLHFVLESRTAEKCSAAFLSTFPIFKISRIRLPIQFRLAFLRNAKADAISAHLLTILSVDTVQSCLAVLQKLLNQMHSGAQQQTMRPLASAFTYFSPHFPLLQKDCP